jgi:Holliday junction resolvase RusA-like endonuclease
MYESQQQDQDENTMGTKGLKLADVEREHASISHYFYTLQGKRMMHPIDDMVLCYDGPGRSISFVAKGTPIVQERPRIHRIAGGNFRVYDPTSRKKLAFKAAVRREMVALGNIDFPFFTADSAIHVKVKFVLPRRVADVVGQATLAPDAQTHPHGPDIDNLLKFVMDALEPTLYRDDTNIVHVEVEKAYPTNLAVRVGWTCVEMSRVEFVV